MTTTLSRRTLLGGALAAGALLLPDGFTLAQHTTIGPESSGGIGWPREPFEETYGTGTTSGDLLAYPNPYLDGSRLYVRFQDEVATFIEMSIPDGSTVDADQAANVLRNIMPEDASQIATWLIGNSSLEVPAFVFTEFDAPSMHMAGSGATRMQTVFATTAENVPVRMAVSLAIPEGADRFAPAPGSVGVGDSGDAWTQVYGEGHDGEAAMGTYSSRYDIDPWDGVEMRAHRTEGSDTEIILIIAKSEDGVSGQDGFDFAEQILPQDAQLQAAYEAFAIPDRPQGWGTSTWELPDGDLVLLFILGAGDGSDHVVEVGSALYQAR